MSNCEVMTLKFSNYHFQRIMLLQKLQKAILESKMKKLQIPPRKMTIFDFQILEFRNRYYERIINLQHSQNWYLKDHIKDYRSKKQYKSLRKGTGNKWLHRKKWKKKGKRFKIQPLHIPIKYRSQTISYRSSMTWRRNRHNGHLSRCCKYDRDLPSDIARI